MLLILRSPFPATNIFPLHPVWRLLALMARCRGPKMTFPSSATSCFRLGKRSSITLSQNLAKRSVVASHSKGILHIDECGRSSIIYQTTGLHVHNYVHSSDYSSSNTPLIYYHWTAPASQDSRHGQSWWFRPRKPRSLWISILPRKFSLGGRGPLVRWLSTPKLAMALFREFILFCQSAYANILAANPQLSMLYWHVLVKLPRKRITPVCLMHALRLRRFITSDIDVILAILFWFYALRAYSPPFYFTFLIWAPAVVLFLFSSPLFPSKSCIDSQNSILSSWRRNIIKIVSGTVVIENMIEHHKDQRRFQTQQS